MDIKLITLVEKFPHLYDKSERLYKDKLAAQNSWQYIAKELHLSVIDCTNRWNSIRNRFSKERAKAMPSGSAGDVKEWKLLKYLKFLNKVVKKRKTFGNVMEITGLPETERESQPTQEITYLLDEDTAKILHENIEVNIEDSDADEDFTPVLNSPCTTRNCTAEKPNVRSKQTNVGIAEKLSDAVGTFQSFVATRTADTAEDDAIKHFCLSFVPH
ncbi:hypothetical protein FQR65_LT08296 [Abscondita terminalis]|nr:hypothetical protein FQR65_LT08296 [Abscondita terminalis]